MTGEDDEFADRLAAHLDRLAEREDDDAPADERVSAVAEALRSPATWSEPPDIRAALLARVGAAAPAASPPEPAAPRPPAEPAPVTPPVTATPPAPAAPEPELATVTPLRPRWQRLAVAVPLAAAAAAVVTLAVLGVQQALQPDPEARFAAVQGDVSYSVEAFDTPSGFRISLETENLPAAPPGTYYSAWLRPAGPNTDDVVPIGTFHGRRVGEPIVLWSGVDPADHPRFSVTLQRIGDPPTPSGEVVLRGEFRD